MKYLIHIVFLLCTITVCGQRTTYTTIQTGGWKNAITWDQVSIPPSNQTDNNHDIVINHDLVLTGTLSVKNGTTIHITGCNSLTISENVLFANGSSLLIDECATLIVTGNFTNNNNSTNVIINGSLTVSGNYTGGNGSEMSGTGNMDIEGTVTTNGNATVFGSEADCTENCNSSNDCNLDCESLPIDLFAFDCDYVNNIIELRWTTLTEFGNSFFVVERSTDVRTWYIIGTVFGSGFSLTKKHYVFTDYYSLQGINYYRITQVDFDGTRKTFKEISCENFTENEIFLLYYVDMLGNIVNEPPNGIYLKVGKYANGDYFSEKIVKTN